MSEGVASSLPADLGAAPFTRIVILSCARCTVNEHLQLDNAQNANQVGLFDTPGLLTEAQPGGTGLVFGTGILRVVGGASTITGNVDMRTAGGTQFFGVSVDSGSSLLIDGVLYGSNSGNSNLAMNLVKLGDGPLEVRGANSATVTGFAGVLMTGPKTPPLRTRTVTLLDAVLPLVSVAVAVTVWKPSATAPLDHVAW